MFATNFVCDELSNDEFEGCQRQMVESHGSDPDARDLCRVLRLPGFFHCKRESFMSRLIGGSGERHSREWMRAAFSPINRDESNAPAVKGDMPHSDAAEALIRSWIEAIPGQKAEARHDWFTQGLMFARLGDDWAEVPGRGDIRLESWEALSRKCDGYEAGGTGCADKWDEILRYAASPRANPVTFRSLHLAAKAAGWTWATSGIDPTLVEAAQRALSEAQGRFERPSPEDCFDFVEINDDRSGEQCEAKPRRDPWEGITMGDAEEMLLAQSESPLVAGLLEQGAFSVWYGEPKVEKSFILLSMADAIAAANPGQGTRPSGD